MGLFVGLNVTPELQLIGPRNYHDTHKRRYLLAVFFVKPESIVCEDYYRQPST